MANKLYNDTSIKAIANAIRAKNGKTDTYTVAEMAGAINNIPVGQSVNSVITNYSINNQAIADFDANVTYTDDYSTSQMGTYDHPISYTKYGKPNGANPTNIVQGQLTLTDVNMGRTYTFAVNDNETIYNVSPNGVCYYTITNNSKVVSDGQLNPTGKVRTLYGTTLKNCRDLGGWTCDGGTVKYGKLFRTSELTGNSRPTEQMTEIEAAMITELLGVKCEIDLRDVTEAGGTPSFDDTVDYLWQPIGNYAYALSAANLPKIKTVMEKIINNVISGIPTLYHCVAGADRTGTISWLLLGLLGVSQSDCDKEYELTCLSGPARFRNKEYSTNRWLSGLYAKVMSYGKTTFKANIIETFRVIGIDEELVNAFRRAMINGSPTDVSYDVPPLTITQNGTYDVSDVNQAIVNTPSPSGRMSITQNGLVDVSQYAEAEVNVIVGDYNITVMDNGDGTINLDIVDSVIPNLYDMSKVTALYDIDGQQIDSGAGTVSATIIDIQTVRGTKQIGLYPTFAVEKGKTYRVAFSAKAGITSGTSAGAVFVYSGTGRVVDVARPSFTKDWQDFEYTFSMASARSYNVNILIQANENSTQIKNLVINEVTA